MKITRHALSIFAFTFALALSTASDATLVQGQFLPEQPAAAGVAVNGAMGVLVINGDQYPLPAELNPVSATTIFLSPAGQMVVSHRAPLITDTCSGFSVQHMYHRVPANPGQALALIRTVCLDEPRAFQGFYEQPGASTQQVAALREQSALTRFDQRISFVRLDISPGVVASQFYAEDVESVQFSPSGTAALVKYDLPGGAIDPADYRFIDLCPSTFGNLLANFPDVGAGAQAAVEADGAGGFRIRFTHPSFAGGASLIPIADCLGSSPEPPPGEQSLLVTLTGNGSGRVVSNPTGINCPSAGCQSNFADNTSVVLTAAPDLGSTFSGWAGDCSGTQSPLTVLMDQDRQCQAIFSRPAADLTLGCSAPTNVVAGDQWAVQLDVANAGPDSGINTSLIVAPAAGLSLAPTGSSAGCFALSDGSVACSLFDLPVGESAEINLAYDVDPFARGSVLAAASVSNSLSDPIGGNNECSVSATLNVDVDLALVKSASPDPVAPGGLLVYRLDVTNAGRSGALGVEITDNLPPEVSPVFPSAAGTCEVGEVSPGSLVSATLVTRVAYNQSVGSQITNSATVTTTDPDPILADNSAVASVSVQTVAPQPTSGFFQVDRDFVNGRFDPSLPAQSGANTAYFAGTGNGNPGLYVNIGGTATIEAYGSRRSIPGLGGAYVNLGVSVSTPTLDGLATAFFGQYSGNAGIASSVVSIADGCVARGLFDESFLADDPTNPRPFTVITDVQLVGQRLAFASNAGRVVGVREPNGSLNLLVRPDTVLPASSGAQEMGVIGSMAFDGSAVAFSVAAGCGQNIPQCSYQGLFITDGAALTRVADTGTPIPGGSGNFAGFAYGGNEMSMHNGALAFVGYDSQLRAGIYLSDGAGLTELVGPNTPIPGSTALFDTTGVANFGGVLSLSAPALHNGVVAFAGGNPGAGITGLWIIRQGNIEPIIRAGELINGDRVDGVEVGPEGLSDDVLAFRARVAISGQSAGANDAIFTTAVNTRVLFANGFEP